VEEVHKLVVDGINAALDVVALVKGITVKTGSNLYLTRETLKMMKRRDSAKAGTPRFRVLRNATNRLVMRKKLTSNSETLAKSSSDPRVLLQLANDALGKAPASLPPALVNATGSMTSGKREAAETINAYFISKVDSLRAASESSTVMSDAVHLATDASNSAVDAADKAMEVADKATEVANKATDVPDPEKSPPSPSSSPSQRRGKLRR
jgi:methyl-accepting chemotaxis protein